MKRYSTDSRMGIMHLGKGDKKIQLRLETLRTPISTMEKRQLSLLRSDLEELVRNNWGDFEAGFIDIHVLPCDLVILAKDSNDTLVGLASIDNKILCGRHINYFELTVVDKKFESLKLSFLLNFELMKRIIINNFLKGKFGLEFLVITPNMKVLGSLANLASFIYPNPYTLDVKSGRIPDADEETWMLAKDLINKSGNPKRPLHKNGLVLEDSYLETPWLIYKKGEQPKHRDDIVNSFGEKYLQYDKETGKELIVRVKFNLRDILRGTLK